MQQLPKPFPAWVGFFFAAALFVDNVIIVASGYYDVPRWAVAAWWVFALCGYVYYLACIFRLHQIIQAGSEGSFRNTPWKVVISSIIPIFGFFYSIVWPIELASYLEPNGVKINRIAPGVTLLLSFLFMQKIGFLGMAAVFGVVMYLTNAINTYRAAKETATNPAYAT